mmetsp:Transcript_16743/g.55687  ORF Transcript_16743/g.55687 Transcript_16743/m.55687 type:complete len:214 (+) Transcript_16743:92-733(+)
MLQPQRHQLPNPNIFIRLLLRSYVTSISTSCLIGSVRGPAGIYSTLVSPAFIPFTPSSNPLIVLPLPKATAKPCRDLDVSITTFPSAVLAKMERITRSPSSAVSTIPNLSPGAVVVLRILYLTPDSVCIKPPSSPARAGATPPARMKAAAPLKSCLLATTVLGVVHACFSFAEQRRWSRGETYPWQMSTNRNSAKLKTTLCPAVAAMTSFDFR